MSGAAALLDHSHPALAVALDAGLKSASAEAALHFYDEPHRKYHERSHLLEMLNTVVELKLQLTAAQTLAILFHDIVYVPGAARGSNEAMSAQLMRVYAPHVPPDILTAAFAIIIDTADHVPRTGAAEVVLDLDLMRLGATPANFDLHSHQVFAEQRPLIAIKDDAAAWLFFDDRRVPFFQLILARPTVFHTPLMRERFERACRINLSNAVLNARQRAHR